MTRIAIKPARSRHTAAALNPLSYPGRLAFIAALAILATTLSVGCSSESITGPTPMPEPEPQAEAQPQVTPVLEPLPLPVTPFGEADLIVSIINFSPGAPEAGDEITFWVFVKNVGNASATASKLRFRVGGESQPPVVSVPELAPDKQYCYTRKVTLSVAQSYQATAWADDLGQIDESDEGNNTTARVFTVAP